MTRGELNRMMVIPAGIVAIGILAYIAFFLPRTNETVAANCTEQEVLQAPSGHGLQLCETLYEVQPSNDTWAVVRIIDPSLAGVRAEQSDHDWACETWGLPALQRDPRPSRIIVQIMAEWFPRGEPAPGITQSIEAYSEQNATCVWELL